MMDTIGTDKGGQRQGDRSTEVDELDLHDGRFRRAWFAAQIRQLAGMRGLMAKAGRFDHRDADHLELPEGLTVLSTSSRPTVPARSGRYRAEDRELGLPDPPPGRRGAGRGDHR